MFFVTFGVWLQVVVFVSLLSGVLATLQYLLSGSHRITLGICWVFKGFGTVFVRFLSQNKEAELAGKEKHGDSPSLTTSVVKGKVVGETSSMSTA
jgi:hypothetical protein